MQTQSITKIEFKAETHLPQKPIKQPKREERLRSEETKRSESLKSIRSEDMPNTPPFSVRNLDLVHTHGKYKNVIPTLDFDKLNKKKTKGKKADKKEEKKIDMNLTGNIIMMQILYS